MLKSKLVISAILLLFSNIVAATTYTFTGPTFTTVAGTYNVTMSITGSFTTASPLPANMPFTAIGPAGSGLATSWSFNDGINTLTNLNSDEFGGFPSGFQISTDASGQISNYSIALISPLAPPPHIVGDSIDLIFISSTGSYTAYDGNNCLIVNGATDHCSAVSGNFNRGNVPAAPAGIWAILPLAATGVPSLSSWSIALLSILLGFVGLRRRTGTFN